MSRAAYRIVRGFVLLAVVFIASVVGYRYFHDLSWLGAIWMTVITISGTGFAEESTQSPGFQLYTICVILFGFFSAAYAFWSLLQFLLAGEIEPGPSSEGTVEFRFRDFGFLMRDDYYRLQSN